MRDHTGHASVVDVVENELPPLEVAVRALAERAAGGDSSGRGRWHDPR